MIFKRMGADITRNVSAAKDNILSTSRCSLLLAELVFLATAFFVLTTAFFIAGLATAVMLVFFAGARLEVWAMAKGYHFKRVSTSDRKASAHSRLVLPSACCVSP